MFQFVSSSLCKRVLAHAAVAVCLVLCSATDLSAYPVSLTQGHISGTITFTADFVPTTMTVYAGNPLSEPTRYESQVAAVLTNTQTNGTQITTTWSYDITVEAQATTHYYLMPVAKYNSSSPFVDENIPFPDYPLNNAAPIVVSPGGSPGTPYDINYQPVILQGTLATTDLSNTNLPPRSLFLNAVDTTPETIQPNCTGSIDQCLSIPQSITALANYEVYLKPGRSYQLNSQAFTLEEDQLGNGAYESVEFNDGDVVDATSTPPGGIITNNYTFHEIAELTGTLGLQVPPGWTVYNSGATISGTTTEGKPFDQEFFPPSFTQATGYIARLFNFVDLTQPISIAPNYQLSLDGTTALYFPNQAIGNINPGQNTFNLAQQAGVLNGKFTFFPPYRVTNVYPEIQVESSTLGSTIEPFTPDPVNGGSYSLLASVGSWPYWRFGWNFNLSDPNFTSYYVINNWLQLASPQINSVNDAITNNFLFNTALLKVYFTAPTASTLSDPELDVNTEDPAQLLYETGRAEGLNQNNVTTGEARQVLRVSDPGNPVPFLVNPSAIVNGSRVTFGPFHVTPFPGQIIVVGVPGNIQLTVTSPQPNATSTNGQFTVTGFAGGTQINSITINGQQAPFAPAATPTDPNRVSFSWPITISAGPIVVTATGLDNAQVTDTVPVTVLLVSPTVTFTGAPPTAPYGTQFTVTATTNASTTPTITASGPCTINGNLVTITGSTGTCLLTANWPADSHYTAATATQTTQAEKVTATVVLSDLVQTYTGNPITVTATVSPTVCGPANVTYNGSTTPPTAIGTYSVTATVVNPNCTPATTTGTLIVNAFAGNACIVALDGSAAQAFNASGTVAVRAKCGIQVNSNNTKALVVSGNATVQASGIAVVGGVSINGKPANVTPAPMTGQSAEIDPIAGVVAPVVGACNFTNWHNNSTVLNPGVYCGGISISGGMKVTFNPGTYILLGGGLSISGNSDAVGKDVTFYNTGNSTYAYKPVAITGGSQTSLAAPRSGPLAGVLVFQDRNIKNNQQNMVSGGSGTMFEGAFYFPTTPLVYSGGSQATHGAYTLLVADTVTFTGNAAAYLTVLGQ